MHRRTTSSVDVRGAAQLPWPRRYGTPPWAVARQLSGSTGTPWQAKAISPWGRSGALKEIRTAAARQPVPVFVGSRWLPPARRAGARPRPAGLRTLVGTRRHHHRRRLRRRLPVAGRMVERHGSACCPADRRGLTVRAPGQPWVDIAQRREAA